MTNALRTLIRRFVRATRNWPGPRHVYAETYRQAVAAVGRLTRANQSVVGIYTRNSYADGTWVPGISDIDLTVVFRNASAHDLDGFHERYDRLRTVFPMLGELELFEERHVAAWTARGYAGGQACHWRRVGGTHRLQVCYRGNERLDRLRHATAIYRYNLFPLFSHAAKADLTVQRGVAKLFRLFDKPPPSSSDPSQLLAACLRELSDQIASVPVDHQAAPLDYVTLLGDCASAGRQAPARTSVRCTALLGRGDDDIPRYALVSTGTTELDRELAGTIVMDLPVFRFYLCHVDPLEYLGLLRARTTFGGSDVLATPFPLSRPMLRDSVRHYAVQMLTVPYRRELAAMTAVEFRDLFYGWFLRTLRFFEDGRMDFQYHGLRDYFGSRHLDDGGETRTALLLGVADDLAPHLLAQE